MVKIITSVNIDHTYLHKLEDISQKYYNGNKSYAFEMAIVALEKAIAEDKIPYVKGIIDFKPRILNKAKS